MIKTNQTTIWLLSGDVSIQYFTHKDLFESSSQEVQNLRKRISEEGWGKQLLDLRDKETKMWGNGLYSPKWISTHYTLLELINLGISPDVKELNESAELLLNKLWFNKGQVRKDRFQDQCVASMILSICCYFKIQSKKLNEIVDYIIDKQFPDGGWNCSWERGANKSSVHTTLTTLEAIRDYNKNNYHYKKGILIKQSKEAQEFLLKHQIFKTIRTNEVMKKSFTYASYPCRWKYDFLRCLGYFQSIDFPYDSRMKPAIDLLIKKKKKNGTWTVQNKHAGLVHFDMERSGKASRWNTLRALRILKKYQQHVIT